MDYRWTTLYVCPTHTVSFSSCSRRGVCHLLPQHGQHPPHALWPLTFLQLLCLAHLQRHGQVPHVPLADRGGGCGIFTEDWRRLLKREFPRVGSRLDLALRQAPVKGKNLCLDMGQQTRSSWVSKPCYPRGRLGDSFPQCKFGRG